MKRSRMPGISLVVAALACYGGYRAWQDYTSPYRLVHQDSRHYLVEKKTECMKEITGNFQLGDLEYRVNGIVEEGKDRVVDIIGQALEKYQENRQKP